MKAALLKLFGIDSGKPTRAPERKAVSNKPGIKPVASQATVRPVTKPTLVKVEPATELNLVVVNETDIPSVVLITNYDEVPEYNNLLTASGGKFPISEDLQSKIAILELPFEKYAILVESEIWGSNHHRTMRKRLHDFVGRINVNEEFKIESSVLRVLYANFEDKKAAHAELQDKDKSKYSKMIDEMVREATRARATDIHMCARNEDNRTGAVLFRIDGIIRRHVVLPYVDLLGMAGYMYTFMAEASSRSEPSFNERAMLSCALKMIIEKNEYKIRLQTVRANGGFDVIMRLLPINKEDNAVTLTQLGYSESQCYALDVASRKTVGAIVVAGVTGSGKSTTLKTLMTMSPRRLQHKSYSIEDPVEYKIRGVTQINVQRSSDSSTTKNPFLQAMRVIMRADPDTIMVGEVRDVESSGMLQVMVQSGHQVMTTVHASSAIEILDRMTSEEMGLSRHTMSSKSFISALIYQRLLPLICKHCRVPAEKGLPTDRLELVRKKFGLDTKKMYTALDNEDGDHGDKCPHCNGLGVRGMTVAAEIIMPSQEFLKLVREGKDTEAEEYYRYTRKTGFDDPDMTGKSAFEHGLYKVSTGLVDLRHLEDNFVPMESYDVYQMKYAEYREVV